MGRTKIMHEFTIYWRYGKREVVRGRDQEAAFQNSGHSTKPLGLFDFCVDGDCNDYVFKNLEWIKKKQNIKK